MNDTSKPPRRSPKASDESLGSLPSAEDNQAEDNHAEENQAEAGHAEASQVVPDADTAAVQASATREEEAPAVAATEAAGAAQDEPAVPTAQADAWFNEALYIAMNPDIANAVARGDVTAEGHWHRSGEREQRAGDRPTLEHLVHLAPPHAGRRGGAEAPDGAMTRFEAAGYGFLNVDLRPLIGQDAEAAQQHWLELGLLEGRRAPGWRPNAGRHISVAGLLARPLGIDLYAPFAHFGPPGRLARRLALALAESGIDTELYAFDLQNGIPRIPSGDRKRGGRHRVSLVLCEPAILQALIDNYPPDHFADSYVIGLWGGDWRSLLRQDSPAESAVDEVWAGGSADAERLAPCLGAPVRAMPWPYDRAATAAERAAARATLGIASTTRTVLFSLCDMLPAWSDRPMIDVGRVQLRRVLEAFRQLPPEDDALLLVQAPRDPVLPQLADLLAGLPAEPPGEGIGNRIMVVPAPTRLDQDPALQAAADVLLRGSDTLADGLRGMAFLAAGRAVIAPAGLVVPDPAWGSVDSVAAEACEIAFADPAQRHMVFPVYQAGALAQALIQALIQVLDQRLAPHAEDAQHDSREDAGRFAAALRARVAELGLDARPLSFIGHFGAGSDLGQPTIFAGLSERSRDQLEKLAHRPFFDLLLIVPAHGPAADLAVVERSLAALSAQTYALRRILLVAATDGSGPDLRGLETVHAGAAVLTPRSGLSLFEALTEALDACTGSHLVFVEAGALARPWALTELAIAADTRGSTSFFAESEIEHGAERRETRRGRSEHRLTSQLDVGPLLCVPHGVLTRLLPLSEIVVGDPCFALAARLIARSCRVEPIEFVLTVVPTALVQDFRPARTQLLAEIGSAEAARLLTNPRTGVTRLAPPLERLPPVTLVVTALDLAADGKALATLRRFSQTVYGQLRLALIASTSLQGRLDNTVLGELGVTVQYVDAPGDAAALRHRGLIVATTPLVVFVDGDAGMLDDGWLTELAEPALTPGFGAAGVVVACGGATPSHIQDVAAVDGACLLVDRVAALEAGGFEAGYWRAAEVALCLALRSNGMRVVVVPEAGVDVPSHDGRPLLDELQAEWGSFVPDDFGQPIRPIRTRQSRSGHATAANLRIRPQRDTAPAAAVVPAPRGEPVPPAPRPSSGAWRRSV